MSDGVTTRTAGVTHRDAKNTRSKLAAVDRSVRAMLPVIGESLYGWTAAYNARGRPRAAESGSRTCAIQCHDAHADRSARIVWRRNGVGAFRREVRRSESAGDFRCRPHPAFQVSPGSRPQ